MAITLRILRTAGPSTTIVVPDGSSATIAPSGDVDVCLAASDIKADYDTEALVRSGPTSRYTVSAATTGHGHPPDVGRFCDIFTNIHDIDPTDPEVRPLVRAALVTNTNDPDPTTTRNRNVDIELELTQTEISRIKLHEHRRSFTFCPVSTPQE